MTDKWSWYTVLPQAFLIPSDPTPHILRPTHKPLHSPGRMSNDKQWHWVAGTGAIPVLQLGARIWHREITSPVTLLISETESVKAHEKSKWWRTLDLTEGLSLTQARNLVFDSPSIHLVTLFLKNTCSNIRSLWLNLGLPTLSSHWRENLGSLKISDLSWSHFQGQNFSRNFH